MTTAHINVIGTAVPPRQVHDIFVEYVRRSLDDPKLRKLFDRMAARAGIERRYSFFEVNSPADDAGEDGGKYFGQDVWPSTADRMKYYEAWAPQLAIEAIEALRPNIADEGITHVVVASCTGFVAPGLDQIIIKKTGIAASAERTVIGFMGCYAAVNALRYAHHIVRSEPAARVLVVNVELCSLHLQQSAEIDKLLAMLLFGDGASAALVTAEPHGIALADFRSAAIADTAHAITWEIRDHGFVMHLDGIVPGCIAAALGKELERNDDGGILRGQQPGDFDLWAVHAGGRTILDAVERAFRLPAAALGRSRDVLRDFGNMSSVTLMFVLKGILEDRAREPAAMSGNKGMAMAFGPGMAAETFRFQVV